MLINILSFKSFKILYINIYATKIILIFKIELVVM